MKPIRPTVRLAAAVALVIATASCGGDDDAATATTAAAPAANTDTTAAGATGAATTPATDSPANADDVCATFEEMLASEDGSPEEAAAFASLRDVLAPDDAAVIADLETQLQDLPEDAFPEPEFFDTVDAALGIYDRECDPATLDVVARDYAFEDLPDSMSTGHTLVRFTNTGTEVHEFIVFKKADGETRSGLDLVMDDAWESITDVGFAVAFPGDTALGYADLTEPGEYFALCFLPVGATPDAFHELIAEMIAAEGVPGEGAPDGPDEGGDHEGEDAGNGHEGDGDEDGDEGPPPHFAVGMISDFTVTG